jgi:hypothetical protein
MVGETFRELVEAELHKDTGFLGPPLLHREPFSTMSFNQLEGRERRDDGEGVTPS